MEEESSCLAHAKKNIPLEVFYFIFEFFGDLLEESSWAVFYAAECSFFFFFLKKFKLYMVISHVANLLFEFKFLNITIWLFFFFCDFFSNIYIYIYISFMI